jgi:hypothetical protein
MLKPPFKELRQRGLTWLEIISGLNGRDQARTFDLALSLCTLEAVPLTAPLSGGGIRHVNDD